MSLLNRLIKTFTARIKPGKGEKTIRNERRYYHSQEQKQRTAETVNPDPKIVQYYANLEIPYGSDLNTVKASWKKMMRRYHPDLHGNDPVKQHVAEELSQKLNHAYKELTNYLNTKNN